MKDPNAVLTDLDDTLIDFSGSVEACWRDVCAEAAGQLGNFRAHDLVSAITRSRVWFWSDRERARKGRMDLRTASRQIVHHALLSLGIDRPEVAGEMADRYRDRRDAKVCLVSGAIDALQRLRRHGARLALITNGATIEQRTKIERFGLAPYFDYILIEEEFGAGKPDPRVYQAALRALACDSEQAWSIGDNLEWDVGAPQQLGLFAIWIDVSGKGLPSGTRIRPDRIISSIAAI
jgi:putative hydrolase of the HAD superfamily